MRIGAFRLRCAFGMWPGHLQAGGWRGGRGLALTATDHQVHRQGTQWRLGQRRPVPQVPKRQQHKQPMQQHGQKDRRPRLPSEPRMIPHVIGHLSLGGLHGVTLLINRPLRYWSPMKIKLYQGDLPDGLKLGPLVAIDTETLGLNPQRDRLCLAQLSSGDGVCHAVQFAAGQYDAPNLKALLADPNVTKLFHFARFDIAMFRQYLGVDCKPIYCTKIASKLVRTYTDKHGLKDLVRELLNVELSKEQQSSDWGAGELSERQLAYAANDVAYLHQLKTALDQMLAREGRTELAQACFEFLPARARLDLAGWEEVDIFAH
jgi:ribonuclease D